MKFILSICTSLMLMTISMNSFSQTKLNHVAYYVKDLAKSGVFYGEILGLEETEEPFKVGRHLWYNLGDNVTLHLIQGLSEDLIFKRNNHLCLSVEDLDAFMDHLKSKDITFTDAAGEINGVNVRPDGIRQIYLQDPTGYWIEINDDH